MALYDELPVYKASYDLLLEIFKFTKNFSREHKYTVGESLKKETLELITLIYRANSKAEKWQTLVVAENPVEFIETAKNKSLWWSRLMQNGLRKRFRLTNQVTPEPRFPAVSGVYLE